MSPGKLTNAPIFPFRTRKEAATLSAYASCPNCAMLTGFDEDASSIMVLGGKGSCIWERKCLRPFVGPSEFIGAHQRDGIMRESRG